MKKTAPLFIVVAGILWGCIGLFVRPLNSQNLNSMEIVAIRAYVTLISLFIFLLIYDRRLLWIRIKDLWCFIGTGICSIVFFNYCYFSCITLASLSVAAILLYTAPAIVMVLSFFLFGEKFSKRKTVSLVLTFLGCVLVTGVIGNTKVLSIRGILVGLGAGFGYALYSIFGKYAIERGYNSLTITFYTFLVASVGCLFIADNKGIINTVTINYKIGLFCVVFGIICTVLPYLAYTIGLKYVENGKASIIASIEPVTATLLGIIFYKEQLSYSGFVGIILVLSGLEIMG